MHISAHHIQHHTRVLSIPTSPYSTLAQHVSSCRRLLAMAPACRQQQHHASCVVDSSSTLPQHQQQQQQQPIGTRTAAAAVLSGARLAVLAAVLLLALWMLSAHQVLAGLHHSQQQQHHEQQQQQQQQPSEPCTLTFDHKDIARLSHAQFKYESPFIDTQGMHSPLWERLPEDVWLPLGPVALATWQALQPHMAAARRHLAGRGDNVMFNACDSAVLFALARVLQPSRVIEVGSGFSTHMLAKALRRNARETGRPVARHTCVEPHRSHVLQGLPGVEVVKKRIQDVDPALFDELGAGDLLFLDNSHVVRPYGDVVWELLYILPRLRPGVVVHFHDVFLPFEYPMAWMMKEVRPYTEQWMVAALLLGNAQWEVLLQTGQALEEALPAGALEGGVCGVGANATAAARLAGLAARGSSLYIRRRSPDVPPSAA